MSIGMSYKEYWYGKPSMVVAYKRAYDYTRKKRNEEMWVQGMYIERAVTTAISSHFSKGKVKYYEEPLDIYPKTVEEKELEKEKARRKVIAFFDNLKQRWDSNNGNNR